jgi:hypothetical protein
MDSTRRARLFLLALLIAVTSLVELKLFVPTASAVVGRPLTPVSYAGVARRTTRRAVYAGAATNAYNPYW